MHLNGEGHYYERKLGRDHIHMACLRCGKITEFVSKTFESLKKQLERRLPFSHPCGAARSRWVLLCLPALAALICR